MSRRNKRRPHVREPKPIFYLLCEGDNTEPGYFRALEQAYPNVSLDISAVGVPKAVAEQAVARAKTAGVAPKSKKPRDSFAQNDQVWAVFNRDKHEPYRDAVARCKQSNVGVACSDPCFELWLVLHERDYDAPCTSAEITAELSQLRPEYRQRGRGAKMVNGADMIKRLDIAERRAETQLQRRYNEGDPFGNPSTTVGQLTRAIREASDAWT